MTKYVMILNGLKNRRLWTFLAWQDIKQRYRGSVIGPFWTVGNLALTVLGIGFLYSALLGVELEGYFPFLSAGLLVWFFISVSITDATVAFVQGAPMLKQSRVSPVVFPMRVVARNLIVFAHNSIVFAVVAVLFRVMPDPVHFLYTFPLLVVNVIWISIVVGLIAARYRDIAQLIAQLMAFFLFVTPLFWSADSFTGARAAFVMFNPFTHLVEIVRAPLLGLAPDPQNLAVSAVMAVVGWIVALASLGAFQRRVVFWV